MWLFGTPLQIAHQEIVDALPGTAFIHAGMGLLRELYSRPSF
jgi:hypothetical protein